jgi:hypothetical protein
MNPIFVPPVPGAPVAPPPVPPPAVLVAQAPAVNAMATTMDRLSNLFLGMVNPSDNLVREW